MIIKKEDYIMDVDVEQTKDYYKSNSLCDCPSCRNYYAQAKDNFHLLNDFLLEFGVNIERPDELRCAEVDGNIKYIFAVYTVCGKILELDKYKIDLCEDSGALSVVIRNPYVPDERRKDYFVITVYNISLPWIIN